jgi:hypothetical protein
MNKTDPSLWNTWFSTITDKERENLNTLIHTRRINISHNNIKANVPRKLVKIVNRTNTDTNI